MPVRHMLNCLVQNEPGVLSRVSGILAGRGFNIGASWIGDVPEVGADACFPCQIRSSCAKPRSEISRGCVSCSEGRTA